ncbi:MAG: hypothetical protein Q4C67_03915 [Deinococcus sp.]|nr:hypothetical protein [Deinococcus sp.]
MNTSSPGLRALSRQVILAAAPLLLAGTLLGGGALAAQAPQRSPAPLLSAQRPAPALLSAPALLEKAQQAAGLPRSGLVALHERVQTSEEGELTPYIRDTWTDFRGQRLRITDYAGQTLDTVHLLTPAAGLLYTPQHGTVPVPQQRAETLRWNLYSGVGGLGAAAAPGVRLRAPGLQTWLPDSPQPIKGTVLEATWPDGTAWHYLVDPNTGRLLADRSADKDLALLTFSYSEPRVAGIGSGAAKERAKDVAAQALEVRTLLLPGGEVVYREQVLTRELNPALPPQTFELPGSGAKSGGAQ